MGVYRSGRKFFSRHRTVFSLGFVGLMISSLGDLLAGITLGAMTNTLSLLPGLIVLIPPAIGMRGNIFGALGSRLGTSMHVGTFELSLRKGTILRENLESSLLLTMLMSFLMGVLAKSVCDLLGIVSISLADFVFISVVGGVLSGLILVIINMLVATVGFRRNWDIDNFSAPVITAAGDIVTLPMLFLASIVVQALRTTSIPFSDIFLVIFFIVSVILVYLVVRAGRTELRRIFIHSAPVLTLAIILDIAAGVTIDNSLESLIALPALLVIIPPFLEDANALGGILTSRLASQLHMGVLAPSRFPNRTALENFAIIYVFSLWVFVLVGFSSFIVASLLGLATPSLASMIILSLVAGFITVTILCIISYYVAISTYRFALDPDDHGIPLTSSAIDSVGAVALMAVILVMGLGAA